MQPVTHEETDREALQHGLEIMEELIVYLKSEGKPLPVAKLVLA